MSHKTETMEFGQLAYNDKFVMDDMDGIFMKFSDYDASNSNGGEYQFGESEQVNRIIEDE